MRVVDMFTLKPIDDGPHRRAAPRRPAGASSSLEDHLAYGGLATRDRRRRSPIAASASPPSSGSGIPQVYAGFGEDEQLRDKHGYGLDATIAAARRVIAQPEPHGGGANREDRRRHEDRRPARSRRGGPAAASGSSTSPSSRSVPRMCGSASPTPAICGSDPHVAEGFFGTDACPRAMGTSCPGSSRRSASARHRNGLQRRRPGRRQLPAVLRHVRPLPRRDVSEFCENTAGTSTAGHGRVCRVARVPGVPPAGRGLCSVGAPCWSRPSVAVRIADKTQPAGGRPGRSSAGRRDRALVLQIMKQYGASSLTLVEPVAARREMACVMVRSM